MSETARMTDYTKMTKAQLIVEIGIRDELLDCFQTNSDSDRDELAELWRRGEWHAVWQTWRMENER